MNTIPSTMHGIVLTGHGGLEQLQYREDLPVPAPKENEVLIKVAAAAVNNTDINTRVGWYSKNSGSDDASWSGAALAFPRIQGADVCGTIVATGESVDNNRVGERVLVEPCITQLNGDTLPSPWYFGSECNGGFAQYTVVSAAHAVAVNSTLTDIELASFPCSYSTAENMLTRANVQAGETVLITGASGGVGSAAIQLAKARGATVIAITNKHKAQSVLNAGADSIIPRQTPLLEELGQNSVDVVIDLVAGDAFNSFAELLRPKGRYAVAGAIGGASVSMDIRSFYLKDLSFFGCTVLEPEVFRQLITRIEQNDIKPLVASTYPLQQIKQAQTAFQEKNHVGKIVLTVQ